MAGTESPLRFAKNAITTATNGAIGSIQREILSKFIHPSAHRG
ncbi:hypothetical protein RBSH_00624 [Rhodopirellula baltica SH28]|uniref:Uncharacterized protein n=1 Tax=Rhodopirellula baltica SH28 TaxID=993517 RepID=K5DN31_RHOBT|nr:hypothetical protein RBSH_00624 [Rhodopirellula baltica SH28]